MKTIILTILSLAFSVSSHAQDHKRQKVEELLNAMDADSVIDTMYQSMGQQFQGLGEQMGLKPEDRPIFDKYMNDVFSLMRKEMSWDKMEEPMIDIYMMHYTDTEIEDMLAFYRSETGRSMVIKMPAVMKDSVTLSQQMMGDIIPKIQKLAQEMSHELQNNRNSR